MYNKIVDCMTNPIKCKLLLEIHARGQTTAKHLAELYKDIPQATLYRYLKRMTSDGILTIVEQNQVRGAVEKTFSLALDLKKESEKLLENNSGDAYMQLFMQYILGFAKQFQSYCSQDNINILEDMTGFTVAPVYISKEELDSAMTEISKIISPLINNQPTAGRKLRTVGIIVSPTEKT